MSFQLKMKHILTIAVFATSAAFLTAAEKPNFSGEWSLDLEKSNLGPMGGPASMTQKIDHNDPDMSIVRSVTGGPAGDQTINLKYTTDGKETTNELMGVPVKTVATWDGSVLVIKMSADAGGNQIQITDRFTLSDDGKVMTEAEHLVLAQNEIDLRLVMNKK